MKMIEMQPNFAALYYAEGQLTPADTLLTGC